MARGLSGYLDALFNNQMAAYLRENFPINVDFLADYPDFLSFVMVIALAMLLAVGVKESSWFNNIFTVVNLCTVSLILVCCALKADLKNWNIPREVAEKNNAGEGGFMPYGVMKFKFFHQKFFN